MATIDPTQLILSASDLLNANTVIITGIFVLLTISILSKRAGHFALILIILTVIPFVVSTFALITSVGLTPVEMAFYFGIAKITFLVGLGWIVLSIALIAVIIAKNPEQQP